MSESDRTSRSADAGRSAISDGPAGVVHLTAGQAARILGVSPKTVNRWADAGRIPCGVTLGGHRRFRLDVIRGIAASMGVDTSTAAVDAS